MKIARNTLFMVLFLIAGLIGGAMSNKLFATSSAEVAVKDATETNDGQIWEYSAVSKASYLNSNRAGAYWITYFKESGFKVEDVEDRATRDAALALAFAKLGDEGWEMVGPGSIEVRGKKLDAFYFKRPKR